MRRRSWAVLGSALVLVSGGASCGDDDDTTDGANRAEEDADSSTESLSGEVVVFAAASLTDAYEEIADAFEAQNPDVTVTLSFAGSSGLAQQIADGAPADVLATADQRSLETVVDAGAMSAEGPDVFASNQLVLAVPAGNPGEVDGLDDLADAERFVGLCAAEVPCGRLAADALSGSGIQASVDTYEPDVRALLTKLVAGELDAGLVYRTDAQAAGDDVEVVESAEADLGEATTEYPVAVMTTGGNPTAGAAFVDFVLGNDGQSILADYGFGPP